MRRVACALLCLAPLAVAAAPPPDIDAYVQASMQTFHPPGMALAIVEGNKTVLARGYGIRKLGDKTRNDEHTIFPIGSCTKAFTAAALAILVDEGKLSWEDRVADKLPGFRLYDPYASAEMTVRDLLVHRSGLGLGAGDLLWLGGSDYTRKGLIERLRYIKPATSFRYGFAYDNVLYVVAGQLVEQVAGLSWEDFVARRILAPLGMKDSTPVTGGALRVRNHATLHARLNGAMRGLGDLQVLPERGSGLDSAAIAPAGSIYSSAADMAQWIKVQLAHGALPGGQRLFSEAQSRAMWTGMTIEHWGGGLPAVLDARKPNFNLYALGWSVQDYRGHKIIQHAGAVFGGLAVVVLLPEKNVGFAAMVNSEDGAGRWAIMYHLLDYYLGLEPLDWNAKYKQAIDEIVARATEAMKQLPAEATAGPGGGVGPSLPLEKYAGAYQDAWYGGATIKYDGKALAISFDHTPVLHAPLEHVRYDTFRTRFADRNIEDAYVTFALNPDGTIDTMKMKPVSPLADFSFDYQDLLFTPVAKKGPGGRP